MSVIRAWPSWRPQRRPRQTSSSDMQMESRWHRRFSHHSSEQRTALLGSRYPPHRRDNSRARCGDQPSVEPSQPDVAIILANIASAAAACLGIFVWFERLLILGRGIYVVSRMGSRRNLRGPASNVRRRHQSDAARYSGGFSVGLTTGRILGGAEPVAVEVLDFVHKGVSRVGDRRTHGLPLDIPGTGAYGIHGGATIRDPQRE